MTERRVSVATHWGSYIAVVESGRLMRIEPKPDDPTPSPIGPGMVKAADDSARVLRPAVRKGWLNGEPRAHDTSRGADAFVEVSWDRAITLVSDELRRVRSLHGDGAVFGGSYGWASAGRFHHAQGQLHRFLALGGGYTDARNTYSTAALEVILPHVIGGHPWSYQSRMPMWDEIADNCELVVAFGGLALKNSQINPGGLARHQTRELQLRCREAGVRFVSVSPIRSDAAGFLDAEWLPIVPNTDTAAMLGIAHTMLVNRWHDEDFLRRCCVGFDRFASYLTGEVDGIPKDAAWAERITGIGRDVIIDLARRLATQRSVIMVNYAVQRADHGEQPIWMSVVLAAMAGSMGRPGGGWGAGYATMDATGVAPDRPFVATIPAVANPVADFIPVARIADALLHPGEVIDYDGRRLTLPELRLVYWCGGNPFHHHQDLHRLARAWQAPDTVVVHEAWWNTSAKFADIVLPVATSLERDDFAAGFSDPHIVAMPKVREPAGESRTDHQIFAALASRLGYEREFTESRSESEWVRHLYEQTRATLGGDAALPSFEEFWRSSTVALPPLTGPFPGNFGDLRTDPRRSPLPTPSGRIEIFSEKIDSFGYDDCAGHPKWFEPEEWLRADRSDRYPLHLISNQPASRLHSQYDNGGFSLDSKINGREPATINPLDAASRGIADGMIVRVYNDRGSCLAGVVVSDDVMQGVIQLSTGAWWDPVQPGRSGTLDRHSNPNVLTADRPCSRLSQGPSALSALVDVERYDGPLPDVLAYSPPSLDGE
ncbi:molybdopterin-dependent oxidoreductase [Actinomadura harenae]|uniref:Asp-tRNA(Asn)/Glu-tRNA(Gln) amidotransferase GatCAB subunit C n=1 Tax=Actinomadura harenae TaxID=2483351 RepID=A0A3M2LNF2_9ACTN|nr:molybdopterin-dependent oxidoreductase [Actinomadura harenae]RMI38991.1 Asp-tRNA(Asn)/Glu-tRNA(Gln) amidotransferase GatCAB subunit C [Actinomadura harenae]